MDFHHPACLDREHLLKDCEVVRSRASGPGGQHRNKVESAIELTHRPTGVQAGASERRSQSENLSVALFRLRVSLAIVHRIGFSIGVHPTILWQSRRQKDGRIALNPEHEDFPAMLAEALEVVAHTKLDPARAALVLGCSASQILKILRHEPRALIWLNEQRESRGLHRLM
jgi:hypothetical protein